MSIQKSNYKFKKISKKNLIFSLIFLLIFLNQNNYKFYSKSSFDINGYLSCPVELRIKGENIFKVDLTTNSEYIESFGVTLYINSTQIDQIWLVRKDYNFSDVFNKLIYINFNNYSNIDDLSKVKIGVSGRDKYGQNFISSCDYTSLVLDK